MTATRIFLFLILYCTAEEGQLTVKWSVKSNPMVFGKTAELICSAPELTGCDHCFSKTKWLKGLTVVIYEDNSINLSKYEQIAEKNGSILQIKDFDLEDVNVKYTCTINYISYSEILKMDEKLMELMPLKQDILVNIEEEIDFIVFEINIYKVFPVPKCNVVANNTPLVNRSVVQWSKIGVFYNTSFTIIIFDTIILKRVKCISDLTVSCFFDNSKDSIYEGSPNRTCLNEDSPITKLFPTTDESIAVTVPVCVILAFLIHVLLSLSVKRLKSKHRYQRLSQNDPEKQDMALLTEQTDKKYKKDKHLLSKKIRNRMTNIPGQRSKDVEQIIEWNLLKLFLYSVNKASELIVKGVFTSLIDYFDALKVYIVDECFCKKTRKKEGIINQIAAYEEVPKKGEWCSFKKIRKKKRELTSIPAQSARDMNKIVSWQNSHLKSHSKMTLYRTSPEKKSDYKVITTFTRTCIRAQIARTQKNIPTQGAKDVKRIIQWNKSNLEDFTKRESFSYEHNSAPRKPTSASPSEQVNYRSNAISCYGNFMYERVIELDQKEQPRKRIRTSEEHLKNILKQTNWRPF